jgi:branched-chain amino acid aminotransferase
MSISYANSRFIDTQEVTFPFSSDPLGTLRGYRVFTSCRTVNGKIFRLDDHIDRLLSEAAEIHMPVAQSKDDITRLLLDTLLRNRHLNQDLLLLIVLSGGAADDSGMAPIGPAHFYIIVSPLKVPSTDVYQQGLSLATYAFERSFSTVKLLDYVGGVVAQQTVVKEHHAHSCLFVSLDADPVWLEGVTFNIFAIRNGTLYTPPLDGRILVGVTRRVVIELAQKIGYPCHERPIFRSETPTFDEVFITSSTRGAVPIVRIDQITIGTGLPGPITGCIVDAYNAYLIDY